MSTREMFEASARVYECHGRWEEAVWHRLQAASDLPNPTAPQPPEDVEGGWDPDWYESPFGYNAEFAEHVSLDGTGTAGLTKFTPGMVRRVLAKGDDGDYAVGIVELVDGRWISWESYHGDPTGSGFHLDAYGGNAQIGVASTPGPCLEYLSERGREALVWA